MAGRVGDAVAGQPSAPGFTAAGHARRLADWLETRWAFALAALVALYTLAYTFLNLYRMRALRQGFDFLVYEQPIWNTIHGRPFAQSMYSFAPTHLGVDLTLFELWVAPFFAAWQSPVTLFALISLGAGLGAVPIYRLARERYGSAVAGLAWAALSLLYFPVGTITLDEFQPRLFAATALLWAYWYAKVRRPVACWLALLVALTVRSDVGLVVGCFGLYWLLARRSWHYGLLPAVVGFGYWLAAVFVVVPALADGKAFLWQINYQWLGGSSREIVTTIFTHPLYTARGIVTLEKARYLAQLLWPLLCLPVLRPRLLLIPLPILALNLLSGRVVQFDLYHQYQALIVPFLLLAALYGLADLRDADRRGRARRLALLGAAALAAALVLLPVWPGSAASRNSLHPGSAALIPLILAAIVAVPLALALLWRARPVGGGAPVAFALSAIFGLMSLQHLALNSEVIAFLKHPGPSPRLAPARALIARVPGDAPLAVTSQLGIHVPLRQALYHFPGNDSYDPALVARARYVLADCQRDADERAALDRLQASGDWRVVAEASDFVLLERVQP